RRAQGLPALSINWGPWAESGMAAKLADVERQRMSEAGMAPLQTGQALEAMDYLLSVGSAQAGVFDLDWSRILKQYPDPSQKTVFSRFVSTDSADQTENLLNTLLECDEGRRAGILSHAVAAALCEVIGV